MEFDRDGEPVDARGRNSYVERYIHAAIYRVRPDVKAIVHSHSPDIIPYSVTGVTSAARLSLTAHFSGWARRSLTRKKDFGDTDMLIRDNKLGDALAKVLGKSAVALIRGHGFVAVAGSTQTGGLSRDLHAGERAGAGRKDEAGNHQISDARGSGKAQAVVEGTSGRPWELWKSQVGKIE